MSDLDKILKTKDFYEILGVSKQATDEEIKKAYKKGALKYHPDKQKTQEDTKKAQEVFQKFAQAYDCLSNPEKRKFYDVHGTDDPQDRYESHFNTNVSPDDIFKMFFGDQFASGGSFFEELNRGMGGRQGSFRNGNTFYFSTNIGGDPFAAFNRAARGRRHYQQEDEDFQEIHDQQKYQRRQNQNQQYRQQRQQQQRVKKQFNLFTTICQFLPIIFILFFSGVFKSIFNIFKEEENYSMKYSYYYSDLRATQLLNVPYYVNEKKFDQKVQKYDDFLQNLEYKIETSYINQLRTKCYEGQQQKKKYSQQRNMARSERDKKFYENKFKEVDTSSCQKINDLRSQHPEIDVKY
ncbi:DnaJ domain [Pseudocohnilembus persalinus]|uniref:DnaJ domain n=1 Tax=Pseudocohnilembus persalinus TaxID=266149 RepID=A0A0V0QK79_PSEPJ|nr:DnaJ domain [Pseudocohnilembus persalinus]|eukprot:KRX02580.1 DnaJ domain [Pseudocohnilembus persalinus]